MHIILGAAPGALALGTMTKEDLIMTAVFFGLFFVIFGFGGIAAKHIPCKSGSMLYEILHEDWDQDKQEETDKEKPMLLEESTQQETLSSVNDDGE